MHIYVNITVYLHSSYMFRCVIHHLQGGLSYFCFMKQISIDNTVEKPRGFELKYE